MRFAKARDASHAAVRDGLRALGVRVLDLGSAGCGVPDLLCVHKGQCYWLEVKRPGPAHARKLTEAEALFATFVEVHVVQTLEDAMDVLGMRRAA